MYCHSPASILKHNPIGRIKINYYLFIARRQNTNVLFSESILTKSLQTDANNQKCSLMCINEIIIFFSQFFFSLSITWPEGGRHIKTDGDSTQRARKEFQTCVWLNYLYHIFLSYHNVGNTALPSFMSECMTNSLKGSQKLKIPKIGPCDGRKPANHSFANMSVTLSTKS